MRALFSRCPPKFESGLRYNLCACRVRASIVCKACLAAEAANPLQHHGLLWDLDMGFGYGIWIWDLVMGWINWHLEGYCTGNKHLYEHFKLTELQWHLRDTHCLSNLSITGVAGEFLNMRIALTRLETLDLQGWSYTLQGAEQLLHLQELMNLKVGLLSLSPAGRPLLSALHMRHTYTTYLVAFSRLMW